MNPLAFALLADENIAPEVVAPDSALLARATSENRVIVTHGVDFGLLAVRQRLPFVGVIFLRPGHISSSFVLQTIDALRSADVDVEPPFLIVAEHRRNRILIRLRREP